MKRKIFVLLTVCLILFTFTACGTGKENTDEMHMEKNLRLVINDVEVAVLWEDNEAVTALKKLVSFSSLTVQMSMYGGFEQVGALGASLPRNDKHTTT